MISIASSDNYSGLDYYASHLLNYYLPSLKPYKVLAGLYCMIMEVPISSLLIVYRHCDVFCTCIISYLFLLVGSFYVLRERGVSIYGKGGRIVCI